MIRISSVRTTPPTTVRIAVLMAGLCVAAAATAADSGGKQSLEQRQIQALQQQLAAVQAQMKQLAEQNQTLLQKELDLERQVARQAALAQAIARSHRHGHRHRQRRPRFHRHWYRRHPRRARPVRRPLRPALRFPTCGCGATAKSTTPVRPATRARRRPILRARVFGIGYAFDSRTEFNSEYEVEHAIASATDSGEFEVEQFYVDRRLSDAATLRAGLFLMPFGLLNEHHEPTNFYGVQRNFVETLIIPSTWREGGFNVHGDTAQGFSWNAGSHGVRPVQVELHSRVPAVRDGARYRAQRRGAAAATHQELQLANAHDLSQYVALGYYGVPGLTWARRSAAARR